MQENMTVDFSQFEYALSLLGKCTDDYMFILDFKTDHYALSETALEVFKLEEAQFYNATAVFKELMYPEDYPMVIEDLTAIRERGQRTHNLEYRWMNRYGMPVWISCRGQVITDEDGEAHYLVGRIAEIGKRNKIDNVTSLYNEQVLRSRYYKRISDKIIRGYMMLIGIDNFKQINEKYGHEFGNGILANMAEIIRGQIKEGQEVYRMEGDSIVVIDWNGDREGEAKELYKKIRSALGKSVEANGYERFHTISAGAVYFDSSDAQYDKLLEQLNFVLHSAKMQGKNTFVLYDEAEYEKYIRQLDIQESLRRSIEDNFKGFELYYQPIVNVKRQGVYGAEALLRWNSDKYGFMSPAEFIPILEESSLIIPLGRWIMETGLNQCMKWQQMVPGFRMNINLSFVQIQKSNILADALDCISRVGIDVKNIVFEVTESGEIETSQATQNALKDFKERSICLAIDDFGTGYSNLRYIKEKMFDLIKIDRIFIRSIMQSEYDYMLVEHITELAHSMNLQVCYEGVETEEELQAVNKLNPDYIQGYYYGKPVKAAEFEEKFLGCAVGK